jgi:hypothetical protein
MMDAVLDELAECIEEVVAALDDSLQLAPPLLRNPNLDRWELPLTTVAQVEQSEIFIRAHAANHCVSLFIL